MPQAEMKTHRLTVNVSMEELTNTLPILIANHLDFAVSVREQAKAQQLQPNEVNAGVLMVEDLVDPDPLVEVPAPDAPSNGKSHAKANGHTNGKTNGDGHANGHANGSSQRKTVMQRDRNFARQLDPDIKDGKLRESRDADIAALKAKFGVNPVYPTYAGISLLQILETLDKKGQPIDRHAVSEKWKQTDFQQGTLGVTLARLIREDCVVRNADRSLSLTDKARRELFYHHGTRHI